MCRGEKMNSCKQCIVTPPIYEVKVEGEENRVVMKKIASFIKSKGIAYVEHTQIYYVNEVDMKDFYYFCIDHFDVEQLYYRIDSSEAWLTFDGILNVLETSWVDSLIKEERVMFWAQPIVDRQQNIYAHELLARFKGEDSSLLSPAQVFNTAKARNRLYALDKMCRIQAIKSAVHLPQKVFINFIPTSIYSPEHCLKSTTAIANKLGLHPAKLVFEVVESEYVEDIAHLKSILEYYREQGFHYALDDVGEGFNTIEVLQDLKPHYMKLDKSYVQDVATKSSKQEIAIKLLNKANEVNAIPLAEGIETEEDFMWLVETGFQLFQGYWLGKPKPIDM